MKGSVDIFQAMLANIIVVVGFIIVVLFVGELSAFNAIVTKPSIDVIQVIDKTHQIESCIENTEVQNIQEKLEACKSSSKYVEIADLNGNTWKSGSKEDGVRDHSIWTTINIGDEPKLARLYVKI